MKTMVMSLKSPKREAKEMMTYNTEWEAKDFLGNTIRCSHENEGKYTQQTKQIHTSVNPQTRENIYRMYDGSLQETLIQSHGIRKKATELLTSEKIYGEDSLNVTNLAEVQYTVKFPSGNPSRTSFGMSDFLDFKYEKLQELSKTVKSPYLADLERRVNPYK